MRCSLNNSLNNNLNNNGRPRVVITGVGVASPNGSNLVEFRAAVLNGVSGIDFQEIRYMGKWPAGTCKFDEYRYQTKKARRRGTRAGAISIYCANEAIIDSKISWKDTDKSRVGVYMGITEHGNVETENEIYELHQNNLNVDLWSHHHNPRTVANNPAGEVTLNLGITGPHYTLGAACAAGNVGLINACQMLQLGEIDFALAGGVSESTHTFGIFAAFKAQGALAFNEIPTIASRPLDVKRNGIVISEGGAILTLERLEDAINRGARIYGEIVGYHINSDSTDFVLPNAERQMDCMSKAIRMAGISADDIDIVSLHATGTDAGDIIECEAVGTIFGNSANVRINGMKDLIGHTMGASGVLELTGNIPSFKDGLIHSFTNVKELDPKCKIRGLVIDGPVKHEVNYILNNSFGMLGINSSLIVKKY
ncbi:MAG: beta-ketoacyl-[acyl-carrier-protein] synthase family protein [Oligoflexia bacterium]|nr:beta-ketoacyl-[acyl-carrier-protein] synthase family protein [Oligoflexia bacterium]